MGPTYGKEKLSYKMNILEQIEKEQIQKLMEGKTIPEFAPGDTVKVNVKVVQRVKV